MGELLHSRFDQIPATLTVVSPARDHRSEKYTAVPTHGVTTRGTQETEQGHTCVTAHFSVPAARTRCL
jgi:hypothetical protein